MMKIKEIKEYKELDILELYHAVGSTNYTDKPSMLKQSFKNSLFVLGAYDEEQLVGLIRVVGDGHSIIYIQDILVLPNYQRQGLGRILINRVLEKFNHVYQKVLMTDNQEKVNAFYTSLGFKRTHDLDLVTFIHRTI